jgi:protein-L-isoaspartate(D-aspartate) O-methyltransferase (PCMT)
MRDGTGRQFPQMSAQDMIAAVVRLLDVQPGARVLEVGTGSGYSTALPACLVGSGGRDRATRVEHDQRVLAPRPFFACRQHCLTQRWMASSLRSAARRACPSEQRPACAVRRSAVAAAWSLSRALPADHAQAFPAEARDRMSGTGSLTQARVVEHRCVRQLFRPVAPNNLSIPPRVTGLFGRQSRTFERWTSDFKAK